MTEPSSLPNDLDACAADDSGAATAREIQPHAKRPKHDITTGPVLPHIARMALPAMAATAFQVSYGVINAIWVGQFVGKEGIAAVNIYQYMFMVFIFFNQLVGIGCVSLISQSFGAKNIEQTKTVIGQTFMFKFYLAVTVTILGWLFGPAAIRSFIADPAVHRLAIPYSLIMFSALPIYFSAFTLNTSFNAIGDMKRPMLITMTSMLLNIILDPIFIVGLGPRLYAFLHIPDSIAATLPVTHGYSVVGAAIATVIAQAVTFTLGVWVFMSGRSFVRLELRNLGRPIWHWIKKMVFIGTPTASGDLLRSVAMMVIAKWVAAFGTAIFAAQGIVGQIFGLFYIPLSGLGSATVAMVGQNLGARKPERSVESVVKSISVGLTIEAAVAVLAYIYAPHIITLFSRDAEVVYAGTRIVRTLAFAFVPLATSAIIGAAFWGGGETRPPMIISTANIWLIQMPLFYFIFAYARTTAMRASVAAGAPDPMYLGWWAVVAGEVINALLLIWAFNRGYWKRIQV